MNSDSSTFEDRISHYLSFEINPDQRPVVGGNDIIPWTVSSVTGGIQGDDYNTPILLTSEIMSQPPQSTYPINNNTMLSFSFLARQVLFLNPQTSDVVFLFPDVTFSADLHPLCPFRCYALRRTNYESRR